MSLSIITVGAQAITLVSRPPVALRDVQWEFSDAVAIVASPYTGQTQAQAWAGADMLRGTMSFPPLQQSQTDAVVAFLMECRGMANAFLLGDPLKKTPAGMAVNSAPVVNGGNNPAGSTQVQTSGWRVNSARLLLPGDWIQIGYRLHRNLNVVTADGSGNATLNLWPSLREQASDGTPIILHNTQGIFRLADNKRAWSADITRLSNVSFRVQEYR